MSETEKVATALFKFIFGGWTPQNLFAQGFDLGQLASCNDVNVMEKLETIAQEIEAMKEIIRDVAATDPYTYDTRRDVSVCIYCDVEFELNKQNHDANCTWLKSVALVEKWKQETQATKKPGE